MSRIISFVVLIGIIVIIGLLFYRVLVGFFIPLFLASVLVVVFRPLHRWVLDKTGHREQLAAGLTTLLIMLTLLLPIALLGAASAVQGLRLIEQNDAKTIALRINQARASLGLQMPPFEGRLRLVNEEINEIVKETVDSFQNNRDGKLARLGTRTVENLKLLQAEVKTLSGPVFDEQFDELIELAQQVGTLDEEEFSASKLAVNLKSRFSTLRTSLLGGSIMALARDTANPTREQIDELVGTAVAYARPRLLTFTGATGTFLAKLIFGSVILIVSTFFFLYDGPAMIKGIMNLSPLDDSYEQELLLEFDRISRAVVLATILSALAQGLTAGVGYYFVGLDYLTLLIMLTTAFAMVPFVGPAVIWVPVCFYLLMNDRALAAGLLATWGVLVVGTIDNIVKAVVLHGQSQLHPLLALLSVLGGVQALGPIGIVVGPMVVAMLQTLLGILQRELVHLEAHSFSLDAMKNHSPLYPNTSARQPPVAAKARTMERELNVVLAEEGSLPKSGLANATPETPEEHLPGSHD